MRGWLFGVLVLTAACIPDRDNPHDPALQPDVVLSVSPIEGTRQTLFTLDASASSGSGALSYCWDLDEDPDFEVPCGGTATLTSSLAIPPGGLGSFGEGAYEKTVRVVVRGRGAPVSRSATVRILNTRPVVDAGPEIVTAAREGNTVHLDGCAHPYGNCASFDPDGDPVSWTWRQVAGDPIVLTTNGRLASFTAPLPEQVLYFELVGDDGLGVTRARTTVRVGTSVWVTTLGPSRVFRIRREIRRVPNPLEVTSQYVAPYPGDNGDLWLGENAQVVRTDADGALLSRFPLSAADYVGRIVPRGSSACIRRDLATGGSEVGILQAPVAGVDGTYLPVAIASVLPSDVQEVLADPDDPSSCIVAAGTKGAYRVGIDGLSSTFIAPGSPPVYFSEDSVLTRDRSFWSASFGKDNGVPRFSITRVGADGSQVTHQSTTSGGEVERIFPLDDETVLVIGRTQDGAGRYAFRANAGAFEPIAVPPLPLALLTYFTSLPDGSIFAWAEAEQTLRRLRVFGNELQVTGIVGSEELSPDGLTGLPLPDVWNGGVAMATLNGFVRISGALRRVEQVATAASLTVAPSVSEDPATGSLWIGSQNPGGGVNRVDASGRIVATLADVGPSDFLMPARAAHPDASVSIVRFPDAPGSVQIETYDRGGEFLSGFDVPPELGAFDLDADGEVACAWDTSFGTGRVWRVDNQTLTELAVGLVVPIGVATTAGDCWFYDAGTNELHFDAGTGLQTFAPAAFLQPSMRTDPRDGTLWIADTDLVTLRHYSKAGTALTPIAGGSVFEIEKRCASGAGCIEFWTAEANEIVLRSDAGGEIERVALPVPASSSVQTISVSP